MNLYSTKGCFQGEIFMDGWPGEMAVDLMTSDSMCTISSLKQELVWPMKSAVLWGDKPADEDSEEQT